MGGMPRGAKASCNWFTIGMSSLRGILCRPSCPLNLCRKGRDSSRENDPNLFGGSSLQFSLISNQNPFLAHGEKSGQMCSRLAGVSTRGWLASNGSHRRLPTCQRAGFACRPCLPMLTISVYFSSVHRPYTDGQRGKMMINQDRIKNVCGI